MLQVGRATAWGGCAGWLLLGWLLGGNGRAPEQGAVGVTCERAPPPPCLPLSSPLLPWPMALSFALQSLESAIIDHRVRLIILDSVASLARADFAPGSLVERQRMLGRQVRLGVARGRHPTRFCAGRSAGVLHGSLQAPAPPSPPPAPPPPRQASRLKYLAEAFRIPVLVTNQASGGCVAAPPACVRPPACAAAGAATPRLSPHPGSTRSLLPRRSRQPWAARPAGPRAVVGAVAATCRLRWARCGRTASTHGW